MVAYWEAALLDIFDVLGHPTTAPKMLPTPQDEEDMLLARSGLKVEVRFCEGRQMFCLAQATRVWRPLKPKWVMLLSSSRWGGAMYFATQWACSDMSAVMVPKRPGKFFAHSRFVESLEYQVPGFPFLSSRESNLECTHVFIGEW